MRRPLAGAVLAAAALLALAGCGGSSAGTGGLVIHPACSVNSAGWTMKIYNTSGNDITVGSYEVVFFGAGGGETGSQSAYLPSPLVVAAHNSVTDTEDHEYLAPVPAGSVTCRMSSWTP